MPIKRTAGKTASVVRFFSVRAKSGGTYVMF